MASNPLSDVVATQYSRWMYPAPVVDLTAWIESNWQWFDPSHAHHLFWPDRAYQPDMDILVAGCGTNQAAVIAFNNPGSRVLAVDVSQPSLGHHQFLKDKYGLGNLELRQLPIEELGTLRRDFDLIVSTGVLHHLASPEAGMRALASALRPDGGAALMLYAKYGRTGVSMLQSVFREMGLAQDEASLEIVRDVLGLVDTGHPVNSYRAIAPDLEDDAGLVDTFLHGREQTYDINECRALVADAGLNFQGLFFQAPYHLHSPISRPFHNALAALKLEQQWSVMERVNFQNACHFFLACRPERSRASYVIDWASEACLDYVPTYRYRCHFDGQQICRPDWCLPLDEPEIGVLRQVNGRQSLRDIAANLRERRQHPLAQVENAVRYTVERVWKLDFLAITLPTVATSMRIR